MRNNSSLTVLSLALLVTAGTAVAEKSPSLQQQLESLQKALASQQTQLDAQKKQLEAQQAELNALRAAAPAESEKARDVAALQSQVANLNQAADKTRLITQDVPRWSIANSRPTITSADGRASLSIRANVQLDAAHYSQDSLRPLANDYRRGSVGAAANREVNGARDLSDGAYFRRARFGVEGVIARDFNYRFLMELGGSGTEGPTRINDAWISYTGFAPFAVQIGAFSPPANLDDGTTPEDLLFVERASASELSRTLGGADGRLGLGVRGSGSRWMGALTLTSRTVNDAEVFDAQTALVGRAGALVVTGADYNLHLGLSGTYVLHPPDQGADVAGARYGIRFRERPEIRVDSTRLIDTGPIDADHAYAGSAEMAGNWRNFYLQAENYWFGIKRRQPTTLSNPTFGGYYLQGSWVLTGEPHRYNTASAAYQAPRPYLPFSAGGGYGAWELALRYSHTNLNYQEGTLGTAPSENTVRGGLQNILTLGVNWYVNPNLRFLLDYSRIRVERLNPAGPGNLTPFGAVPATPPIGAEIGKDFNAYALRTQFNF
jgi:phosphate-selective porin OprO and OprP